MDDYTPVKIPTELAKHIDEFIQGNPKFRTRAGFVRYVVSYYMDTNKPRREWVDNSDRNFIEKIMKEEKQQQNDHADKTNLEEKVIEIDNSKWIDDNGTLIRYEDYILKKYKQP